MKLKLFVFIFVFTCGTFLGIFIEKKTNKPIDNVKKTTTSNNENRDLRYDKGIFTNPILECSEIENIEYTILKPLKNQLINYYELSKESGKIKEASIYYRDLNNGPWIGINEKMEFTPASLLKLPVLITYLKLSEKMPTILQKKISYEGEFDKDINLSNKEYSLEYGKEYTINEMLNRMIMYSDNLSYDILKKIYALEIPESYKKEITDGISIIWLDSKININNASTKNYSGFFRILYNASFLNQNNSEYALALLSKTNFNDGLTYNIPKEVKVAHKFGIRSAKEDSQINQLHDCGIIYKTNAPYILCVMTKGNEIEELRKFIQDVSKIIYGYE